ncbi:MAG: RDD family protein [Halofilum sp. (in: g-proteobacteria)]
MTRALRASGFWRRAAALGADSLWLFCLGGSVSWMLFGSPLLYEWNSMAEYGSWTLRHGLPAIVFMLGWRFFGATPGKALLDLRVVDARTGGHPGLGRCLLRYIGYFLSALPLGLGFVWMVFDKRQQTFHDKLARTRVVVEEPMLEAPVGAGPREIAR